MPTYTGTVGPNNAPATPPAGQDMTYMSQGSAPAVPDAPQPAQTPYTPGLRSTLGAIGSAYTQGANAAQLNPNQQWIDAFNSSLAKQRGSIDSALSQALGSMGARRDLAAKTITAGSADIQQALKNQNAQNQQAGVNADAHLAPGAVAGANVNDNLYANVINGARSTETASSPLLQLGAQANYDTGAAQLRAAALSAQGGLDQQQAQFAEQQAQQQASFQHDQQMAQLQSKLANPSYDPKNDAVLQRQIYLQQHPELSQTTTDPLLDKRAQAAGLVSGNELNALLQDPLYGWAERALAKPPGQPGTQGNGPTFNWQQILQSVVNNPNGNRIINALYATGALTKQQWEAYGKASASVPTAGGALK